MNSEQLQSQALTLHTTRRRRLAHQAAALLFVVFTVVVSSCSGSSAPDAQSVDVIGTTRGPASVGEQVHSSGGSSATIEREAQGADADSVGSMLNGDSDLGVDPQRDSPQSHDLSTINPDVAARIHEMQDPNHRSHARGIELTSTHGVTFVDPHETLSAADHTIMLGVLNDLLDEYGERLTSVFASRDLNSSEFQQRLERWYHVVDPASPLARDITDRVVQTIGVQGNYLQPNDDGRSFRHVGYRINPTPKFEPQDPDLWWFSWCGRTHSSTVSIATGTIMPGTPVAMRGYGIMANQDGRYWIRDLEVASHEQVDALPSMQCSR